mgnify:CR=1 FL=1
MTNIRELITAHSEAEKVLKLAGQVGSELEKQVYVVGGFVRFGHYVDDRHFQELRAKLLDDQFLVMTDDDDNFLAAERRQVSQRVFENRNAGHFNEALRILSRVGP